MDLLGLLFYSGLISVVIVATVTITAQDTPVENPRRKHALEGLEIKIFIREKDGEVPNPGHFIEFLFRQGLCRGRSQAGFIKRTSPRSRAHTYPSGMSRSEIISHKTTSAPMKSLVPRSQPVSLGAAFFGQPLPLLEAKLVGGWGWGISAAGALMLGGLQLLRFVLLPAWGGTEASGMGAFMKAAPAQVHEKGLRSRHRTPVLPPTYSSLSSNTHPCSDPPPSMLSAAPGENKDSKEEAETS